MPSPADPQFIATDLDSLADIGGKIAVFADPDGRLDAGGRKINTLTRKALARAVASAAFEKLALGDLMALAFPAGLAAQAVLIVKLERRPTVAQARRAGAQLAKAQGEDDLLVLAGNILRADQIALGLALRSYRFDRHKTTKAEPKHHACVRIMTSQTNPNVAGDVTALAQGVAFARDLINEPANVLTTDDFAARLVGLRDLGVSVEVLEEADLHALGMRSLLAVGQGSASGSKVVVMSWQGGRKGDAPLALVGKGVVFDSGGISIKPAQGMEDMTGDMGGAAVVAGVMRILAQRGAKANVVGLVGLVENMPSGTATRPGDIVRSMQGTTIEVINTDAEGRLVLADVLCYAQDRFRPAAMIDLATLTGAIVVALGHENAGVFSNSDPFCAQLLAAAHAEAEGAWRMPLAPAYDEMITSRLADIKNSAGRAAGAITAAQFLQRFVKPDLPWCHLDIAGVAQVKTETAFAPAGATGWGVLTLNRLICDQFEG
jgi:leucyl aminopeptidase